MKKILFIFSVFLMISCGNSEDKISEDPADLKSLNGNYELLELDGEDISAQGFILNFNGTEQRLSGKTGCNNFVATYKIEDSIVKFNPPLGTKMYCEGQMEYEEILNELIPEIRNVRISDKDLIFLSGENQELLNLQKTEDSE
ncbi:META domain-containing protein [Salegentibacter salegens]|uniref:Heat shock protein HslJ n=1 Tax=Salegentibacter salegens TaxID=143223 RepID=A0A1M7LYV4_9FLAO|nr:META domain-containing protein [Salegentibacter salegens]PRX52091.1 heat shock protein HslJ [Salegentibacter salegens]SHM83426.1 Heat shock protein HslJ [Salegentibacter salegens]